MTAKIACTRCVDCLAASRIPSDKGYRNECESRGLLGGATHHWYILDHPAFAGFGPLILPWDDRAYDEEMRLDRISSLLPYHTHVDPVTVASALNRMIDDAAAGKTVFYRFYAEAQRQQQPKRENTCLFFFRGRPAPPSRSCPGGWFSYGGSFHKGFPYADAISRKSHNAFVIKYRAGWIFEAIRFCGASVRNGR